ncbi:MAG: DEAD/DEAH box helicase family protein [Desulfuromonadaceae bacterium]|nr:DEAD/DEAH box helicase family protein [Desulfuromonadaceae bacterium]
MKTLKTLLDGFRTAAVTEREKGTYFEELICTYLRNEAIYHDLYSDVWTYADWATLQGLDGRDAGIDLVVKTSGTGEFHAIQCKFYADDYRVQKSDIDSFFTASGKTHFTYRIIITTTIHWSEHAEDALCSQQPPVSKIDLHDLENSQIDWSQYQPASPPVLKAKKQLRPHQTSALAAVKNGLTQVDRGKLIMACGTGKTFTSLKVAESLAGAGKRVLFLVPVFPCCRNRSLNGHRKAKPRSTALPSVRIVTSAKSAKRTTTRFRLSLTNCATPQPPTRPVSLRK